MTKTAGRKEQDESLRIELEIAVDAMPRGTRAEISRDLGIAPGTISAALNGQMVLPLVLSKIDGWLVGIF